MQEHVGVCGFHSVETLCITVQSIRFGTKDPFKYFRVLGQIAKEILSLNITHYTILVGSDLM